MTNTIHSDLVSNDAPDLRALTKSTCLTRPSGTGRIVTSVTTPLPLRPKLWTTFLRLELSGNGVPYTPRSRSRTVRNNPISQVTNRHLGNGSPPGTRTTSCPRTRRSSSLNDGMAYRHSIDEIKPERVGVGSEVLCKQHVTPSIALTTCCQNHGGCDVLFAQHFTTDTNLTSRMSVSHPIVETTTSPGPRTTSCPGSRWASIPQVPICHLRNGIIPCIPRS